jgi:hypothetical protein
MSRCYTEQRLKLGVCQLPALRQVKRPLVPGKRRVQLTPQQRGRRGEVDGVDLNLRIISLLGDSGHFPDDGAGFLQATEVKQDAAVADQD